MEIVDTRLIVWSAASTAMDGPTGDASLVQPFPGGVLVAVLDGLGHGRLAAEAAQAAVGILERHAGETPIALVRLCHQGLRSSRGVALGLASLDARNGTMSWLGVGSVEGVLLRAGHGDGRRRVSLVQRSGVVGRRLPALVVDRVPLERGDTLILTTDGIPSGYTRQLKAGEAPQALAESILAASDARRDDAMVLVASWRGRSEGSDDA